MKKISFCGDEGVLVIGGAAGQVVVCLPEQLADAGSDCALATVNLIPEKGSADEIAFQWKGSKRLTLKGKTLDDGRVKFASAQSFAPLDIVQMMPPAAITSLALHSKWRLVAVGTAHGLSLYDFKTHSTVIFKCTLNSRGECSSPFRPLQMTVVLVSAHGARWCVVVFTQISRL